jgi:ArsR family transcriptional regulator
LVLLQREELTVAELAAITLLAQPRVSTHLAKLRDFDLVKHRKAGVQSYYRFNDAGCNATIKSLWSSVRAATEDALLSDDGDRLPTILAARARTRQWADSVAGDMERHYSPGRTWEATARATLPLLELGDVLDVASGDGALAELLASRSRQLTCVDLSPSVVEAGKKRLGHHPNVGFHLADMHALPFPDNAFDVVLLMHALTYTRKPAEVINELARVRLPPP